MQSYIDTYKNMRKRLKAYEYAMWVLSWDLETETPEGALDYRSEQVEVLTTELYALQTDSAYLEAIDKLYATRNSLDELLRREIEKIVKDMRLIKKMPKDEYIQYQVLMSKSSSIWAEAKAKNDFNLFLPTLEKIIDFTRKTTKYLQTPELKGYDVLLDMYEEGMTMKEYDAFFLNLREELVPFVLSATSGKKPLSRKLTKGFFSIEKQKEFNKYLTTVFNFDLNRGVLKQSVHPFESNFSSTDVRITTKYLENAVESAVFSTIHEMGHGIYEQQISKDLIDTRLNMGASMGIHESQSRMYENMIGRSYAFWENHFDKLKEIFAKELKGVSLLDFYQYINRAERTLIRTEADELTYPLHIMVRYEIEKQLISGKLKAKDLPKKWRKLYQQYVGVRPKTDAEGVLQDIHWAGGSFGYFPTYALGSAYAAQIYQAMNKDFNIENAISNNEIYKINDWLREKIHQYGSSKSPKELILNATGEPFNSKYYVDYLKRKFSN
ncbi:carboxypeptidase M32 [Acholeplasma hippikon]|uniref:Metal-dependent carboxypeptidase n=1 Tax=Acholeplasma hippikon TaxID=264636 RepID=A0A449BHU3_9MOLU|nr:carboxypeptidase M32 [Acholeplasma hippikon]VEU82031.1 Putative metalloprotease ypwA [Acholeplasma hippikon]